MINNTNNDNQDNTSSYVPSQYFNNVINKALKEALDNVIDNQDPVPTNIQEHPDTQILLQTIEELDQKIRSLKSNNEELQSNNRRLHSENFQIKNKFPMLKDAIMTRSLSLTLYSELKQRAEYDNFALFSKITELEQQLALSKEKIEIMTQSMQDIYFAEAVSQPALDTQLNEIIVKVDQKIRDIIKSATLQISNINQEKLAEAHRNMAIARNTNLSEQTRVEMLNLYLSSN